MTGLFHGCRHAKIWRQQLTTHIARTNNMGDYIHLVDSMAE
jgi:hypothetical protein